MLLVDTSVVCRVLMPKDQRHVAVVESLTAQRAEGQRLIVAPQVIYECYVVLTRPRDVNGGGLEPAEAVEGIRAFIQSHQVLHDPLDLYDRWLELCQETNTRGKPAHDLRLVAFAACNRLDGILTLNPGDFTRQTAVAILAP